MTAHYRYTILSNTYSNFQRNTFTYGQYGLTHHVFEFVYQGLWKENFHEIFTYSNGLLIEKVKQYPNKARSRNIYTYDNRKGTMDVLYLQSSSFKFDTLSKSVHYYDKSGNELVRLDMKVDSRNILINDFRETKTYNKYNQILTLMPESWNAARNMWEPYNNSSTPKHRYEFYYEETFPSSVKETAANSSIMTLYPVPAAKTLTIDIAQQQAAELVCSIYTIDGKIIRQWNQPATNGQYKETISVAELPTGNYILKASSNGTVFSKQFQVIH